MIKLRGHHIEALAELYAKQEGFFDVVRGKTPTQIVYEMLLEAYKRDYGEEDYKQYINKAKSNPSINSTEDLDEKGKVLDPLFNDWLSQQDLEVRIVFGPDSACEACPSLEGCLGGTRNTIDDKQDKSGLLGYGIDRDKTYTIGDLITIFRAYISKTQFPSPRTKNGFGRSSHDKIIRKNQM